MPNKYNLSISTLLTIACMMSELLGSVHAYFPDDFDGPDRNQPHPAWAVTICFLPLGLALCSLPLLALLVRCEREREEEAEESEEEAEESEEEAEEEATEEEAYSHDPLNHTRLLSAGLTEEDIKNHPILGWFYDPINLTIPDMPTVLNTGQIADEGTALNLVRHRSRMPQGTVTGFFRSAPLTNLLNTAVDEAIDQALKKGNTF